MWSQIKIEYFYEFDSSIFVMIKITVGSYFIIDVQYAFNIFRILIMERLLNKFQRLLIKISACVSNFEAFINDKHIKGMALLFYFRLKISF